MAARHKPLVKRSQYYRQIGRGSLTALVIVCFSLGLGVAGYGFFGNLGFVDALLNACMILTGMGPVSPMLTTGGKLFASFYSLYSGIAFLSVVAVLFGPVFQRFLHRFHLEITEDEDKPEEQQPGTKTNEISNRTAPAGKKQGPVSG